MRNRTRAGWRRPRAGVGVAAVLATVAALVAAGCGSSGGGGSAGASSVVRVSPAAEPAVAPPLTVTPAGVVRPVGDDPEGIVVDTRDELVVAAIRGRRLALLGSGGSGAIRTVAVPGTARHLQLAGPGGPVLVPGEDTDTFAVVDLPSGRAGETVVLGRQPHDAVALGSDRFAVADELGGAVSFVAGGRETARVRGPVQPGGITAAGGRVAAVDVRGNALFVYDGAGRPLARLPAGAGPTHAVALTGDRVAVADTRGNAIEVFALSGTPRRLGRLSLAGTPYGMALAPDGTTLWVTLTARNQVVPVAIGSDGSARVAGAARPTVRQPNSVAVDGASTRLYVTGSTVDGVVEIIDI